MATATDTSTNVRSLLRNQYVKYGLIAVILAAMPTVFGGFLANEIIVFSVFVLGFDLMLGYTGELSFGHAVYLGFGAYGTVLSLEYLVSNFYLAAAISLLIATVGGVVFGYLSLRRRGIYFSMITLALAQMVYYVIFRWTGFTGGSNGMALPDTSAAIGPFSPLTGSMEFYVFGLVVLTATWLGVRRVVRSPFGRTLIAIRENEDRMVHLGYETNSFLWIAFTMSAFVCGIAGVLYSALFGFIAPETIYWTASGDVVIMALLGGIGTLGGPIVGAAAFVFLSDVFTLLTDDWRILFGVIIIFIVLFAPEGIWGMYQDFVEERRSSFGAKSVLDKLGLGSDEK
ncbi:MAG: branched-chain amino acid ABC transporter permease [Haloferacaceae archaeon]